MEQDKRIRREIANSNERRRMQSINAGFQALRSLLPHHEGEKLSKAAILQQTADFISELDRAKTKLTGQNSHLKKVLATVNGGAAAMEASNGTNTATSTSNIGNTSPSPHSPAVDNPPPTIAKRRKTVDGAVESGDEGIGSMSPDHSGEESRSTGELNDLRRETMDLRLQLERERRHRVSLEERIALLQKQHAIYRKLDQRGKIKDLDVVDAAVVAVTPVPAVKATRKRSTKRSHEDTPRCYTLRNNLETIVQAIRHLEGDHLFSDEVNNSSTSASPVPSPKQEVEIGSSLGPVDPDSTCTTVELPIVEVVTTTTPEESDITTITTLLEDESEIDHGSLNFKLCPVTLLKHFVQNSDSVSQLEVDPMMEDIEESPMSPEYVLPDECSTGTHTYSRVHEVPFEVESIVTIIQEHS